MWSKKNILIVSSVLLYIIIVVVFVVSFRYDVWLPFIDIWLLVPCMLIIKDVLLYAVSYAPMQGESYDWWRIDTDRKQWRVPWWYTLSLINRRYIFPIVLTVYLVYLLIQQTGLWHMQYELRYLMLNESYLFWFVLLSGVCLVFGETYDSEYKQKKYSFLTMYVYVLFSIVLWVLWAYIVLQQVLSLWVIGIVIANIAWILVFLVWILLLDESENDRIDNRV